MKNLPIATFLAGALVATSAFAAAPEISIKDDVNPKLAEAQRLVHQAWVNVNGADLDKLPEADAHLEKAKALLVQVNDELRAAVDAKRAAKKERKAERKEDRQERREERKAEKEAKKAEKQAKKEAKKKEKEEREAGTKEK